MEHVIDQSDAVFDGGFDLGSVVAVETSWAINMMLIGSRDSWYLSSFGSIRPPRPIMWMEWVADPGGEDGEIDPETVIRGGAYCGCLAIEPDRRERAVQTRYANRLLTTLMAGEPIALGYQPFESGKVNDAPPAYHLMMLNLWYQVGHAVPIATVGYVLYLDEKGVGLEEYCLAFDMRQATGVDSWQEIIPALASLQAMASGRYKIGPAYHTTSAGIEVRKLLPANIQ